MFCHQNIVSLFPTRLGGLACAYAKTKKKTILVTFLEPEKITDTMRGTDIITLINGLIHGLTDVLILLLTGRGPTTDNFRKEGVVKSHQKKKETYRKEP